MWVWCSKSNTRLTFMTWRADSCQDSGMPRLGEYDHQALAELLRRQHAVLTRAQAFEHGLGREQVRYLLRAGGPWHRLLPGVYLTHTGTATGDQRDMAALLYAGQRG